MGKDSVKTADAVLAAAFISCTFSVAGWALLELWLLQVGAGLRVHGLATLFGLWLGFMSIRRPRIGGTGFPSDEITATSKHHKLGRADAGWVLLFVVVGAILGASVLYGQTIILVGAAMGLALVPWSIQRSPYTDIVTQPFITNARDRLTHAYCVYMEFLRRFSSRYNPQVEPALLIEYGEQSGPSIASATLDAHLFRRIGPDPARLSDAKTSAASTGQEMHGDCGRASLLPALTGALRR